MPHAPGPRVSAYVTMVPVDAAPFLPPGADPSTPLNLLDAATLRYESTNKELPHNWPGKNASDEDDGLKLRRLTAAERAERWRTRAPLIDEDPGEDQMPRRPPGEPDGTPFDGLTALGRRLTGLDAWPLDADERAEKDEM